MQIHYLEIMYLEIMNFIIYYLDIMNFTECVNSLFTNNEFHHTQCKCIIQK